MLLLEVFVQIFDHHSDLILHSFAKCCLILESGQIFDEQCRISSDNFIEISKLFELKIRVNYLVDSIGQNPEEHWIRVYHTDKFAFQLHETRILYFKMLIYCTQNFRVKRLKNQFFIPKFYQTFLKPNLICFL